MGEAITLALIVLFAAASGALWTLWTVHVIRNGVSPIPSLPKIKAFRRQPAEDNGNHEPPPRPARMGP